MKNILLEKSTELNLIGKAISAAKDYIDSWKKDAPEIFIKIFKSLDYLNDYSQLTIRYISYQIEMEREGVCRFKVAVGMPDYPYNISVYFDESGNICRC